MKKQYKIILTSVSKKLIESLQDEDVVSDTIELDVSQIDEAILKSLFKKEYEWDISDFDGLYDY